MLLRHTPTKVAERQALTINPAKTCQPIGAMYAALGVHRCLPHSHGSQGCCAYHRSTLTRHYKEPVMAATSSFTEGSAVFGGQSNLLQAIETIFTVYKPDIIAVHTTCLSETIGDDVPQINAKAADDGKVPAGKHVVNVSTPSYIGSHVTGFARMCTAFVEHFATSSRQRKEQVNIVPGWVEPADMREIRRLCDEMQIASVMLPDTSDVLDAPLTGKHEMYPKGGTTIPQMKSMGDSLATVALGEFASRMAAEALDARCKVPAHVLDLPIGLAATDRLVDALRKIANVDVPDSLIDDRGRLVDLISDMHQYLYGKRVALFGDPDQLIALSEFLVTMDMRPVFVVTGTPGKKFEARMAPIVADVPEAKVRQGAQADMFLLHQWIKNEKVDLIIGNTYGKYIARDEDIPFVRYGFPILDRIGHAQFPTVGYRGGMRIVEKILNAFMDRQDRDASEPSFELTM